MRASSALVMRREARRVFAASFAGGIDLHVRLVSAAETWALTATFAVTRIVKDLVQRHIQVKTRGSSDAYGISFTESALAAVPAQMFNGGLYANLCMALAAPKAP